LKGWQSTDAVHPDDLPGVIAVWTRSVESGQPYDVELRQRGADNVYRWFHVQGLPVRDAEGSIIRWCVLQTDIDEHKRAEEALRESERELRQLIESVPGMIAVGDSEGKSRYLNKRAIDYLDTTVEGFRDRPMDTVHPDDQELLKNEWLRGNELGQPLDLVHRVRRFDGVYRWVDVRGEPLLDDRGRIVRWYYVFTDVDDQWRAEDALRESERELRQIIDSVPGMITVANAAGQQEYGNKRFLDYTGTTVGELMGLDGMKLIHPDEQERVTNEWLRVSALGQPLELDHRLKRFDGVYRWMHVRTEPLSTIEAGLSDGMACSPTSMINGVRKRHCVRVNVTSGCSWRRSLLSSHARGPTAGSTMSTVAWWTIPAARWNKSTWTSSIPTIKTLTCRNGITPWRPENRGTTRIESGAPTESTAGSTTESSRCAIETVVWCPGMP
jgi:PAS domain S-box-containing protein